MLDLKMAFLKLVNNMLVDRSSRLPNSYLTAKSNQLLDHDSSTYHLQAKPCCPVTPKKRRLDKQDTLEASVVEGSCSDPPSTPLLPTARTPLSTSRQTSAVKQHRESAGGSVADQMPRIENISLMGPTDETSRSGFTGTAASKERTDVKGYPAPASSSATPHARHAAAMDDTGALNTPRAAASLGSPAGVDPVDSWTLRCVIRTATTNAIRTLLKDREKLVNKQTYRSDDKIVNYRRMTSQLNATLGLDCKTELDRASSEKRYRDHVEGGGYHSSESSLWPLQPLSSQGVVQPLTSTHRAAPITVPLSSLSALQHKMNDWREKYMREEH